METGKRFMLLILTAAVVVFTSCSSDDDVTPIDDPNEDPQALPMGSFSLASPPLVEGKILVEDFTMPTDGWIVVRRDDGNNRPVMSEIISIPEYVLSGTYAEYSIDLDENSPLQHGERLWINLHDDDGDQIFSDADMPLKIFDVFSGYTLISDSFIVDLSNP